MSHASHVYPGDDRAYCALHTCGQPITDENRTEIGGRWWCGQKCWCLMMDAKTNAEAILEFDARNQENQEKSK